MAEPVKKIKCIEKDIFAQLEAPSNDFLSTPGLIVDKIICDDFIILASGNQIHNFTCQYYINGETPQEKRIKLLMQDNTIDHERAINEAIFSLTHGDIPHQIDEIQRWDAILDNGNRYYCCCIIYEPSAYPNGNLLVKIIEQDDIGKLEKAVNDFLASFPLMIVLQGVLRQEEILANGNKVYSCTIPYIPLIN